MPYQVDKTCTVNSCDKRQHARGWCSFHYTRWKLTGDPTTPVQRQQHRGLQCDVPGCERRRRKVQWCASHYNQVRRVGQVSELQLKSGSFACFACGVATGVRPGYRKFCSDRCKRRWQAHDGSIPDSFVCAMCLKAVAFVRPDGRRRHSDTKLCGRCRSQTRFCVTVGFLATRDGLSCGICGSGVDMSLRAPFADSPSVDHVVPRSLGGQDVPENCQLAHLGCNVRKSNRLISTRAA